MDKVPFIDQSGLFALEDVLLDLYQKEIEILMVGIQSQPKYLMKMIGIIGELIPEERIFDRFADCRIQSQPKYLMKMIGIIGELIPEERIFDRFADCREFIIDEQAKITA
jgi:MFS superfamily sulfate permease-like transporter